jgi:uncharacterized protein (DUF1330 family)
MAAYLVMRIAIGDGDRWRQYREAVVPLIVKFGGRHVTGSGKVELLEGADDGRRIAMFEFPSMAAIRAFWDSPEYVPVKELRRDAAILEAWAVPGA